MNLLDIYRIDQLENNSPHSKSDTAFTIHTNEASSISDEEE